MREHCAEDTSDLETCPDTRDIWEVSAPYESVVAPPARRR